MDHTGPAMQRMKYKNQVHVKAAEILCFYGTPSEANAAAPPCPLQHMHIYLGSRWALQHMFKMLLLLQFSFSLLILWYFLRRPWGWRNSYQAPQICGH